MGVPDCAVLYGRSTYVCVLVDNYPSATPERSGADVPHPEETSSIDVAPSYNFHSSSTPVTLRAVRKKNVSLMEDDSGHIECQEAEKFGLGLTHQRHR